MSNRKHSYIFSAVISTGNISSQSLTYLYNLQATLYCHLFFQDHPPRHASCLTLRVFSVYRAHSLYAGTTVLRVETVLPLTVLPTLITTRAGRLVCQPVNVYSHQKIKPFVGLYYNWIVYNNIL